MKTLTLVVWLALVNPDLLLEHDSTSPSGHVLLEPWASFEAKIEQSIDPSVSPGVSVEQSRTCPPGHVLLDPWASLDVTIEQLIDPSASPGASIDELIDPWAMSPPAQLSLDSLRFPKVDAHELRPFVEPLPLLFEKVDARELKPFPYDS